MEKQALAKLEQGINELIHLSNQLSNSNEYKELLQIIHRPGWTTIPESMLVSGIIDSMISHKNTIIELKKVLMMASRSIGN